ncbi:hypothetical protein [Polaribacter sp. Hel_I_88]|uniref:hypothetical protein n=1 Tax=Polaribacter sp. Hel_I_88 TaxID=1250006 RepID=UPI000479753E|nr:hypothetical protein [Polaribacter sp. Hel_I_88]|tara:strand:+ start:1200 stop:1589 length:390 start_codon:yes stop_codon:yes gene_type:complete
MRIRYKKKQVNLNLYLGIIWFANGIVQTVFNENSSWFDYFWFLLSGTYLIIYFYQKKEKYLTVENGIIKQNWPLGKKMKLNEIKRIKHFAGEYILKSELKKMKINISLIEEESLSELKSELKKLNVEWN